MSSKCIVQKFMKVSVFRFCLPGGNIEISCDKHIDESSSVKSPKDGIY